MVEGGLPEDMYERLSDASVVQNEKVMLMLEYTNLHQKYDTLVRAIQKFINDVSNRDDLIAEELTKVLAKALMS